MSDRTTKVPIAEMRDLATRACVAAGGSADLAKSLVDATVSAALCGRPDLGFPHFVTYLASLRDGRIDGQAEPRVSQPLPAMVHVDARGGIAQLGFDIAFSQLVESAHTFGIAILTLKDSYTTGELGYYVRRLAVDGLVTLATTTGPALMAAAPGTKPVFCTNPIAFGAPTTTGAPLVIDQASSATAYVNLRKAAAKGEALPMGWAIDEWGAPTTDASEALRGALLPFGGYKGANLALMVEMLSAGVSGGSWSLDGGDFQAGNARPNATLTVIAISPHAVDPGFTDRCTKQLARLEGYGVHIPGARCRERDDYANEAVEIALETLAILRAFTAGDYTI